MLRIILTGVQLFSAAIIIALVLLQRGRGADAGAGFGAGASGTVFGARGATTGLSRATAIAAIVFMINSLVLAYTGNREVAVPKPLIETPATVPANSAAPTTTAVPPAATTIDIPTAPATQAPAPQQPAPQR
jgi:preprotein translocase subunit SecG